MMNFRSSIRSRSILLIFALCFFSTLAIGQTLPPAPVNPNAPVKKPIFAWTPEPHCLDVNKVNTETVFAECDQFVTDGTQIRAISYKGIGFAISFTDNGKYLVANSLVVNESGKRILVEPWRWVVFHYKTEDDFWDGKKALTQELAIDPEKVANKAESRFAWANALTAMGGAMARNTATVNDQSGRQIATVTAPNTAAQTNANRQIATNNAKAMTEADGIRAASLRSNTVFEGDSISGLVFFKRNKKAHYTQIMVTIEGITYFFMLTK